MYLLLPFIAVCLYTDLSERKIYNNVVLAGIIVSLIYNVIVLGPLNGAVFTFTGLFTGIFLLIIPFVAGGLGAGDVKMLGMIGAFLGYSMVVEVLLVSALVGGIFAVVTLIRGKGILKRLWRLVSGFIFYMLTQKSVYLHTLDDDEMKRSAIPYGAALSAGVIIIYIMGSLEYNLPGFGPSMF
jgi:prepilin peptidase CpaA